MTRGNSKTKAQLLEEIAELKKKIETDPSRDLFNNAPLPYQSLDAEGNLLDVNAAWLELTGYEREKVIGHSFEEFMVPASAASFKDRFKSFMAKGKVHQAHFTLMKRDGTRILVAIDGRTGHDESGSFSQSHCILHDITDQRRSQRELYSSDKRFRGLFESSLDGIIYTDMFGSILNVNPAFCTMLDSSSEILLGKNIRDINQQKWTVLKDNLLAGKVTEENFPDEFEKEFLHESGRMVPVAVRIWLNRDNKGNAVGAWFLVRDLTEKKAAEGVAAKSEERYRLLAENTGDVIWTLDNDMNYTYVSPSVVRLQGFTPKEMIAGTLEHAMTPESFRQTREAIGKILKAEARRIMDFASRVEMELYCKDGSTTWVESVIRPILNDKGDRIGFIGSTRDVSERKKTEQELMAGKNSLRALLNATIDSVGLFDLDGTMLTINKKMAETIGHPLESAIGKNIFSFFSSKVAKNRKARFNEAIETKAPVLMKDVSLGRIIDSVVYPILGESGEATSMAVYSKDVTDTVLAEEARKHSEEQYRLIVETASEGILGLDANQRITYANQITADLFGYELNEIIGTPVTGLLLEEDLEDHRERTGQSISGERQRYVRRFVRKDGEIVWGLVSASPIQAEDGHHLGSFAMIADITEAREAERLIRESEERYRRIVETANEGILYTKDNGVIAFTNRIMCTMLGYSVSEMLKLNVSDLLFPEDHGDLMVQFERRQRGLSDQFEQRYRHKQGHEIWTLVSASPIFDDSGSYQGSLAMVSDMSDRKKAEKKLRASERKYRNIFEHSVEGLYQSTPDGHFISVNPAMASLLGYESPQDLIDSVTDIATQFYACDDDRSKLLNRLEESGELLDYEVSLTRKDGSVIWISENARVFRSDDGKPLMYEGSVVNITERKQAEEALKLTQFSVDNASIDIYWINRHGQFVYANNKACDSLGYTREELLKLTAMDIYPDFPIEGWPNYWNERRKQELKRFETTHQRKDGSTFPVGITSHYWKYGGQEYLFTYVYDLTERQHAEETLRRNQELLNEVQQISLTGGWELDMVTGEYHLTDGQFQLYGLEPDSVPGDIRRFFETYVHPDDRSRLAEGWSSVIRNKKPVELEYRALKADGTEAILVGVAIPDVDAAGEVRRVYGSTRDVTRERQSEEELKQTHERLLTILDGIEADIFVSDLGTHEILFMNAHMRERFGSPTEGALCHEVFYGNLEQCRFCPKPDILDASGKPLDTVISERYNPFTQRWNLAHDRAIEWLEGKQVHMHMAADITELKNMAEDLKLAMGEAEAASLAKNEFLANMSHEIRTPLNGLLGMLQLLQLTSLMEEQRDYLDTAVDSGRNLLHILNDILDLSKIESGKLELDEYDFELGEILDSVVSVFRYQAEDRGLKMSWKIDQSLPRHFIGDKGRLRQILFNLVGNATKFTDSGSVTVDAYPLHTNPQSGLTRLYFSVTDTGIGIPEDKVTRVFDPFTQVDGSFTRKYKGTGLGLGIVRRLVSLMGGNISIMSEEEKGTTISFTIEVTPREHPARPDPIVQIEQQHRRLSILVAEDERVNRTVVQRLLTKLGHEPVCVKDGELALSTLKSREFDCILMDIQMPGLDGLATTQALRNELKLDVPVIALTAHAMKGDRKRFLEAGMNGYVAKPFDINELQEELERLTKSAE